jgi:hypothetical protein
MARTRTSETELAKAPPSPDGSTDDLDARFADPSPPGDGVNIPSPEPGNLVDLAKFAEDDDDPIRSNIKRIRCSVSRPDNFTRFRTWPNKDWWRIYNFLIRDGGGSVLHYLVSPELLELDELEGRTKRKRLIPYITLSGALGFWPMGVDDTNAYVASGLYICEKALHEWGCAVSRGREDGEYLYKAPNPNKHYGEPKWPEGLTLNELLNRVLPPNRWAT